MGVRGLLSYVLRRDPSKADLVQEAQQKPRQGVTLLVDLLDFCAWFLPEADRTAKGWEPDSTLQVYGSEFLHHDEALCEAIFALRHAGIYLEFFLDPPKGLGLVDVGSPPTQEEAKRCGHSLDAAKAVRQWCRGERGDLPNLGEGRSLAPLFYEQVAATLSRCGCQVWHLNAHEQAPLLSTRRGSEWSHVWGVVSDNIDWAVVPGVRLIPFAFFDLDGVIKPKYTEHVAGWPEVESFMIAYTSAEVIAEQLRLGHPPKEEELKEYVAKGKGKGGRFGQRGWPFKWWFDSVLAELSLLIGTDATTPFIQKHKLYAQIGLRMGQDPVESITKWFRDQLYFKKLRWRDVYLEALSPVLQELVDKDPEFKLALQFSRKVYEQDVNGLRTVVMNLERQKQVAGQQVPTGLREVKDLPPAAGPMLRSAACTGKVRLDVYLEDVSRLGAPTSSQLLGNLRRILYRLLARDAVLETRGDHAGVSNSTVSVQRENALPEAQVIQRWTWSQRWQVFRAILEHNSHQDGEAPEVAVQRAFEASRGDAPVPDWAHGSFGPMVLEYVSSLNRRPEQPLVREHEFDTLAATLALSFDVSLPGAVFAKASAHLQQRLSQVKEMMCHLISTHFHETSEVRLPTRGTAVATYFQASAQLLMDIARLLWLDADFGQGAMVFLPEPRELFSAKIFAALYLAGAYEAWELPLPQSESGWQWEEVMNQLVELRHEVLWSNAFRNWREELLWSLKPGMVAWPTERQLDEERKKSSQLEELPIDEHRDKILKHIENHRVTCIQGETGCGKSTRVPVYVMEEYFEQRRAGNVKKEEKFMVLCTQPRRIACISLAQRVASCIKEPVGESIGYKISGDTRVRPGKTKLVYVTTGYLLQVLVNNPEQINAYSHLILDEVHERDVDSDLLSLVVKLQMAGYNFKLVIMSATLQGDLFTRYFSDKKIKTIFVGVKRYPVEVVHIEQLLDRYGGRSGDFFTKSECTRGYQAPFANNAYRAIKDAERAFGTGGYEAEGWEEENIKVKGEFDDSEEDESGSSAAEEPTKVVVAPKRRRKEVSPNIIRGLDILIYELILRVAQPGEGILIFLPGIGEISDLQETLMPLEDSEKQAHMSWQPGMERHDCHFKVFVLHSLIPKDEQEGAVFDPPPPDTAHIILASNIAESSLTIPKVRVVIDFGLRRQLIYDKRRHMSCLVTTWVSQASAKQRCGRTGRVFEGVNIRLYTKQFYDSYMDEFDPPEMQTAPLEKLYVNVKHLSAKLPAYEVAPNDVRKRTPKELLMLVAQPPEETAIASSIENLDQLGALTNNTESAELTVLGYLMMAVPLDVQLCRLVIFGALLGMPCEGVVCAAATSVQDPFTLPSHLIMKDPKEYAEAVRRSYETRRYFDHGHWSEPLMLRNLFVHFLTEFRRMQIEKASRKGRQHRESTRSAFTRCAQQMAGKFAVVPKRLVNLANAILDTATRLRKFLPEGSMLLKQLEDLMALLQAGDRNYGSPEAAEAALPKVSDLFCADVMKLKALLVMAFTPQFMHGSTKVRAPEQVQVYAKKKKQQEKNKMEILLQEIVEFGLDPTRTVACVLEQPRWNSGRSNPRFGDDLALTLEMITGEKVQMVMAKDNRVLISFGLEDKDEENRKANPFANLEVEPCCTLGEEPGLIKDIATGAHYIDLFGAGRWKFPVHLLSTYKREMEEKRKAEAAAKRKAEAEAKKKAIEEKKAEEKRKVEERQAAKRRAEEERKAEEEKQAAAEAAAEAAERAEEAGMAAVPEEAKTEPEKKEEEGAEEDLKDEDLPKASPKASEGDLSPTQASVAPKPSEGESSVTEVQLAHHNFEHEDGETHEFQETAHLVEIEGEEEEEHLHEVEEEPHGDEELGPPINIYKPVTPYEVNWEMMDTPDASQGQGKRQGKAPKTKIIKGRCQWRNPVGFTCSTDVSEALEMEPWPNDMLAVYTTTQGGDSKDMSWVEGVTLLSSESHNLMAFMLLIAFLRDHQDLYVDVDLMDGRIYSMKGPNGLEHTCTEDQVLLIEDLQVINDLRRALSEAFYSKAPPKITTVEKEEGIDFSGTRGKRDDEPVPQVAAEPRVAEALDRLFQVLRETPTRMHTIDEATWSRRLRLAKSKRQVFPLHRESQRRQGDDLFTLFEPFVDLEQARAEAERKEREEEMRKRQAEEEKRRRKEEERRRKEEEKRMKIEAKREEERRAKGKGKGKEGKGKKGQQQQQQQQQQPRQKQAQQQQAQQAQQAQAQQQQAQASQSSRRQKQKGKKGGASSVDPNTSVLQQPVAYTMPDLPEGWVAVQDPLTGQMYYWNQHTNATTWEKPVMMPMPMPFAGGFFFGPQ